MIKEAITKITAHKDLTRSEMSLAFEEIMKGEAEPAQIAAFIIALRIKGETTDEITAAAGIMRKFAEKINIGEGPVVDTCGTGGSGINTFNISTAAAFVAAGCGVKVAKHGNRSASSACGSADVLEALGVNLNLTPAQVEKCINEIGIGFLYAPLFHLAMKYAAGVRKAIGIRTIFNILGPLANPANATCQVLGVYEKKLTKIMAEVLNNLGVKRAFVVHGLEGLDEISITGPTQVSEVINKKVKTYIIKPEKFGLKRARLKDIEGAGVKENAAMVLSVLNGETGPKRDVVVLNAAYAVYAAEKAGSVKEAVKKAENSIGSGAALAKLNQLIKFSNGR
ncbi:MAG: anthranilate phosphoribosyltransferase [Candidatus Omnitrophica bacterium]|nr:anthranilate phosphoribosyltransferase [Candidatus Omnitrophota bacterium]